MTFVQIIESDLFKTVGIPILICLARMTDVSIGTLRIIFLSKGQTLLAPILGFFEVVIWLAAISQVMGNLNSITNFVAFAIGFSVGNYIGMYIENKLAIGVVVVRIITKRDSHLLVQKLRDLGHSVTVTDAQGNDGPVSIIFLVIKRNNTKNIVPIINLYNPLAMYSIEDIRYVSEASFTKIVPVEKKRFSHLIREIRK